MSNHSMGLIADIGGTNARFALCSTDGEFISPLTLECKNYPSLESAAKAYLTQIHYRGPAIKEAAFAVACPVLSDQVALTNHEEWSFSIEELRNRLQLDHLTVVNDFVAQALAVPLLKENQKIKIGQGDAAQGFPIVVVGPGTGLGVSILVPQPNGCWTALASEGGHATMPAPFPEEERIIAALRQEYGHVSAERVVSGMGLTNLYKTLLTLHGEQAQKIEPAEITQRALNGDALCREAVQMMFGLLGTLAGNLALTAGALGGVYIAGGIVPRDGLLEMFKESSFRVRFEAKGRFTSYLSRIPTYVMKADYPAFLGLYGLIQKNIEN